MVVHRAETNGVERVRPNRFLNVHLHCIVNNPKKISEIWTLPPS